MLLSLTGKLPGLWDWEVLGACGQESAPGKRHIKGTLDLGDGDGSLQEPSLDGKTETGSLLHLTCHSQHLAAHLFTIQIKFYIAINAIWPARCLLAPQPLITGTLTTIS